MALSKTKRIAILEKIIEDEDAPGYQRVQAMALLERLEAAGARAAASEGEQEVDPMTDLDELQPRRLRRR